MKLDNITRKHHKYTKKCSKFDRLCLYFLVTDKNITKSYYVYWFNITY